MLDVKSTFHKLIDELDDEKRELMNKMHTAKLDGLEGWEKVEHLFSQHLEEGKQTFRAKSHLAKLNLLDGWDKVVDKLDETKPSIDELRVRAHLAKLEMLDEWDEVEDKMIKLKGSAESLLDSSEDKLKEGWKLGKKMGDEIRLGLGKIKSKH